MKTDQGISYDVLFYFISWESDRSQLKMLRKYFKEEEFVEE